MMQIILNIESFHLTESKFFQEKTSQWNHSMMTSVFYLSILISSFTFYQPSYIQSIVLYCTYCVRYLEKHSIKNIANTLCSFELSLFHLFQPSSTHLYPCYVIYLFGLITLNNCLATLQQQIIPTDTNYGAGYHNAMKTFF